MAPMQGSPGSDEFHEMSAEEQDEVLAQYLSYASPFPLSGSPGKMSQGPVPVDVKVVNGVSITTQSATGRRTSYPPLVTPGEVNAEQASLPEPTVLPSRPVSKRQAARIAARAAAKSIPNPPPPQEQVLPPGLVEPAAAVDSPAPAAEPEPPVEKKPRQPKRRSIKIRKERRSGRGHDPEGF